MDMNYSQPGVLKVLMTKHLDDIMEEFPELIMKKSHTPHTENHFKMRDADEAEYLSEEMVQAFHSTVESLLLCPAKPDVIFRCQ